MGIFAADASTNRKGLAQTQVSERGTYLHANPGTSTYTLEIVKCLGKGTRKGAAFIVEFRVLAVRDNAPPEVVETFGIKRATVKHPIGSKATWFQKLTDPDIAFSAIKEFLYAVAGFADVREASEKMDSTIEQVAEAAISPANSLAGRRVTVTTEMVKTKAGGDFTRHTWAPAEPIPGQ